jgi:hypothetical protein
MKKQTNNLSKKTEHVENVLYLANQNEIEKFFSEYGQYHGLSRYDINRLVNNNFLGIPLNEAIELGAKLERPEWKQEYFDILLNNHIYSKKQNFSVIGNSMPFVKKYYLFDLLLLMKTKLKYGIKRYLLFGFLPLIRIRYQDNKLKDILLLSVIPFFSNTYDSIRLFGIPVFFKQKLNETYIPIKPGFYSTARMLKFVLKGMFACEAWGAWSRGDSTSFLLKTDDKYIAEFDVKPFLAKGKEKQIVTVYLNGHRKNKYVFEAGQKIPKISLVLPKSERLHIMFKYTDVKSPKDLGLSADGRKITIGFKSLEVKNIMDEKHKC